MSTALLDPGPKPLTQGAQSRGILVALWAFVVIPFAALVAAVPVARYVEFLTPSPYMEQLIRTPFRPDAGLFAWRAQDGLSFDDGDGRLQC